MHAQMCVYTYAYTCNLVWIYNCASVYNERKFCGVEIHNNRAKLIIGLLYHEICNHFFSKFGNDI